jgi:ABC-type lipoprotein release transport system permease subunit
MKTYVKLAWRNVWRNWRRTVIALVAIVLGLVLLLFFDGFINGSDQAIFGNAVRLYGGNIQAHDVGFRDRARRLPILPLEDADRVVSVATAQPEVVAAAKRIATGGIVSSREGSLPVVITAVQPEIEAAYSIQAESVVDGRYLLPGEGDAIFIGRGLAEALEVGVGDRVNLLGRSKHEEMRQRPMTIVGIYDIGMREMEKSAVYMTLEEAQSLYNLRDEVTEVAINLQEIGQEVTVVPALAAELPEYEIDTWDSLRPEIRETLSTKLAFTSAIGFIVIFVASIGILNIQLMAVFERTREMGVLAALGMKSRGIMALFLLEGTLIGALGAIIGVAAGLGLLAWIGRTGIDFSFASGMGEMTALMGDRLYPSVSLADAVSRGITVTIIVMLASFWPAWQASRKEPAESLHHV